MVEHGTLSMYKHYRCRCDACCRAEHEYYLKRSESKIIKRTNSKWNSDSIDVEYKTDKQKRHNKKRYIEYTRTTIYRKRIRWQDIAKTNGMKCSMCGKETNPDDVWLKNGRKCFGRDYPTVDHIISLRNGGEDSLQNTQLLCKHCNSSKGAK